MAAAEEHGYLLPGAKPDAPYGVLTNGRPRLRPTSEQVRKLAKMNITPDQYGWKQQPMQLEPERLEKLRESGKAIGGRAKEVFAAKKAKLVELYGPDYAKAGHTLRDVKIKRVEKPPPPDATDEEKQQIMLPVKKRKRPTVGGKVAAVVENQLAELRAQNEALQAKIDAAAESARGANEAVTTLAKLARQNSLERKKTTSSQGSASSAPPNPLGGTSPAGQPQPMPTPGPKSNDEGGSGGRERPPEPAAVFRGGKWF
jgi:hypothetical protein